MEPAVLGEPREPGLNMPPCFRRGQPWQSDFRFRPCAGGRQWFVWAAKRSRPVATPSMRLLFCQTKLGQASLPVLLGLATLTASAGGLTWQPKRLEFQATTLDGTVEAVYHYENTGSSPVEITQVTTGCHCTTAAPSRSHVAPGEKGELKAIFTIDFRTGLQERPIYVYTDEGKGSPELLELVVDIQELVSVKPKLLFWRVGEAVATKQIQLKPLPKAGVRFGAVRCVEPGYEARLREDGEAGAMLLEISPGSTKEPSQTQVLIEYEQAGRKGQLSAFAAVR